jgi:flagellar basal body-associated protein FliL
VDRSIRIIIVIIIIIIVIASRAGCIRT